MKFYWLIIGWVLLINHQVFAAKDILDELEEDIFSIISKEEKPQEEKDKDKINNIEKDLEAIENVEQDFVDTVIIQGLNKITAHISTFTSKVGASLHFENLEIIVKQCWKTKPNEKPDNKVLLEVLERKQDENRKRIFYGWMFSSNPAISALEHPVYDITIIECKNSKNKGLK